MFISKLQKIMNFTTLCYFFEKGAVDIIMDFCVEA